MAVVFFSFTEANRHTVAKIKGRAVNSKYPHLNFKVRDLLKRWDTEDEIVIRQAITKSIKGTSRTIVFVGEHTHNSKWVKEEVEMTLERGKPVYAMWLKDESGRIPKILKNNDIKIYAWSEAKLHQLATK
ncbi:MAG: TIR domain-containing protein [Bacteroidia bacterium]